MRLFFLIFLLISVTSIQAQVKAQDGRIYKTVKIGDQTWMAENLEVVTYRNGDSIPQVQDSKAWSSLKTGAWCYYGGNLETGFKYGKLYNWYAINDPRGLAPEGWHIPSDMEWTKLTTSLGGKIQASAKMKSPKGWSQGGNGNNETGFSALPGGTRAINEAFSFAGDYGYWWTSTTFDDYSAWNRFLAYNNNYIGRSTGWKQFGNSVRCVKDANENSLAISGGQPVKENENETSSLTPDFANQKTIVREAVKPSMTIGNKIWMTQNLNVDKFQNGDPIPAAKTNSDWQKALQLKQPAWCYYNNDSATGKQYGKLYNWYAIHDQRGLAPSGWHIPAEVEWTQLANEFGGETTAGETMKSNGFDTFLSGFRDIDGAFHNDGLVTYWWGATESSASGASCFSITYFSSAFNSDNAGDKGKGFSVRCVKN
jgi:uncharacterized protein (TIGR02145 family)